MKRSHWVIFFAICLLLGILVFATAVHVIDGRTPHNLIAELFTDRGVGTLVTA